MAKALSVRRRPCGRVWSLCDFNSASKRLATPAWFWPANGAAAIAVGGVQTANGVLLADWRSDTWEIFNGTNFSAITGAVPLSPGHSAIAAGAASDSWTIGYNGTLSHIVPGSAPVQSTVATNSFCTGIAYSGQPFIVTSSGALFNATAQVGIGLGMAPAVGLAGSSTLYTLLHHAGGVAAVIRRRRRRGAGRALSDPAERRRVSDIAFACGFKSEAHFSRAFRQEFSATPSDVRSIAGTPSSIRRPSLPNLAEQYQRWIREQDG